MMIDTGKAFCVANKQFMNGIRDLAQYSSNDAVVEVSILKLVNMINATRHRSIIHPFALEL